MLPSVRAAFRDLKRRHALELVGLMLTAQGRATGGAQNILRALSAMAEDREGLGNALAGRPERCLVHGLQLARR